MTEDMFDDSSLPQEKKLITLDQMIAIRRRLGFTQPVMAEKMGLSKSAYVAIETRAAEFRKIHALAAERVALEWAHHLNVPMSLPYGVYTDINELLKKYSIQDLKNAQVAASEGKIS